MLDAMRRFLRRYDMINAGDVVTCAVSGGADSMALLWGLYLLKDSLGIDLRAAHFNHGLRGIESDRDEAHVVEFCERFDIPLTVGRGAVKSGRMPFWRACPASSPPPTPPMTMPKRC